MVLRQFRCPFGSFWFVLSPFCLFWVVLGQLRSPLGSFVLFWLVLGQFRSHFGSFWLNLSQIRPPLESFGHVMDCFGPSQVFLWIVLARFESYWFVLGCFGLSWVVFGCCVV